MFRYSIFIIFIWTTILGCQSPQKERETEKSSPPNIVLIVADDLGWRDVGFMGNTFVKTPNIDRIASEGMIFTHAYANAPNCAPTRACLMSGQYSPRHGVYTVHPPERGKAEHRKLIPSPNKKVLDADRITIAEALKAGGYVSASMGKWHLGKDEDGGPISQGFDVNIAGGPAGHPKSYFSPYKNPWLEDGPEGEHLTDRISTEATIFIRQNKDRHFFLYLPFYSVHTPIQAKDSLTATYQNKACPPDLEKCHPKYAAMVETMDQGVGRILQTLDELQLTNNTLIIFTSDNGPFFPVSTASPLRGSKGMLYEGGIRVPLAIRFPPLIRPGSQSERPVISLDFYPTLLDVAGIAPQADYELDGVSLTPAFRNKSWPRKTLYWHFPAYLQGYKGMNRWRQTPASAILHESWKLIQSFETGELELYDLAQDEAETTNLAKDKPEKAQELLSLLNEWRTKTHAPVPSEPNPAYDPLSPLEKLCGPFSLCKIYEPSSPRPGEGS